MSETVAQAPIWELPASEQWDRHREQCPGHAATLRCDGVWCNVCPWHTY